MFESSNKQNYWYFGSLATVTLWFFLAGTVAAQSPRFHVTSISPQTAHPGDTVLMHGSGLSVGDGEFFAWIRTPSAGFVLEAPTSVGQDLAAQVGPVAVAATGHVELWQGYGHTLSPKTWRIDGRMLSLVDGRIFVARQKAPQGPLFSALSASPRTEESQTSNSRLKTDFHPIVHYANEVGPSIRVDVVIETGGSTTSGNGDQTLRSPFLKSRSKAGYGPSWAFRVDIELDAPFTDDGPRTAAERLAAAVARVLTQELGSMGLAATAEGSWLVIDSTGGIVGGFATVVTSGG